MARLHGFILPRLHSTFNTPLSTSSGTSLGGMGAGGLGMAVLCDTDPCFGLPLLRNNAPKLHYLRFKTPAEREAYRCALEVL